MAEYRFVTLWQVEAPLEAVYDAVFHSLRWPEWWQGAEEVEQCADGNADGIGSVRRYTWKAKLPYRLRFDARTTRIDRLIALEAVASGDLEGIGKWSFAHDSGVTTVRHDWHVRTTRRWMTLLEPAAASIFTKNHHALMQNGAEGVARLLGARLVEVEHLSLPLSGASTRPFNSFNWLAAMAGGMGAGIVATLVQLILWWIAAVPLPDILLRDARLAAAIVMGPAVLAPPLSLSSAPLASVDWAVMLVATALHFALSAIYGLILALLLTGLRTRHPLPLGTAFGLLVYLANMYGFTLIFPWFVVSRDWITASAHAAFGLTSAWLYLRWSERKVGACATNGR